MFADNFKSGHYSGPIQIDSKLAAHTLRVFMSNQSAKESDSPALRPLLPLLLVLFFGSGCAALIYEIVWFQMLQLVIGSSAVSLGVLLGTYMGGMCLGSLFLALSLIHISEPT